METAMPKEKDKSSSVKDFTKLPFLLYFSGPLYYTSIDLMSEELKIKRPKDIAGVHVEKGRAYGVTFFCENNTGAELLCCMTGNHDKTAPQWLRLEDMHDVNMNEGYDFGIIINADGINLSADQSDDHDSLEQPGEYLSYFLMEDETPDYIILDPNGENLKIDSDGFLYNEDDEPDESSQLIDVEALSELETMQDFSTMNEKSEQDRWINDLWKKYFPKSTVPKITDYIDI